MGTDVNSKSYWDGRFEQDWESNGGREQTAYFTNLAMKLFPYPIKQFITNRNLSILDWGCAEGDGTNILANCFPNSQVSGLDFSEAAIRKARLNYPNHEFMDGELKTYGKKYDVIFTSNCLEHYSNPHDWIKNLMEYTNHFLVILLPFQEYERIDEHFYTFDYDTFNIQFGLFNVVFFKEIESDPNFWPGKQLMLIYANTRSDLYKELKTDWYKSLDINEKTVSEEYYRSLLDKVKERDSIIEYIKRENETNETWIQSLKKEVKIRDESVECLSLELNKKVSEISRLEEETEELKHILNNIQKELDKQVEENSYILKKLNDIEKYSEKLKIINEINKKSVIKVRNELEKVSSTKAWKMMCLMRRVNEQLLKGNSIERKNFFRWIKNKFLKKTILKDLELARFSPISIELQVCEEEPVLSFEHSDEILDMNFIKYSGTHSYDIFRFPVINWDFRWQRPQQISMQFAKNGHRVFYFTVETIGIKKNNASFEDVSSQVWFQEREKNVWEVKLCSKNPLNIYRDTISDREDFQYLKWSIQYIKRKFSIYCSVSILDLPFWSKLAFSIENNKVVYDCMDDHEGFSTNSREMLMNEGELIASSDLVIASSKRLIDKVKLKNENTLLIRNAGEYEHFSTRPANIAIELQNLKGPVIGYYGAISEWFDIELIRFLAHRHPEWTFFLIGDTSGCDISTVESLSNVIFVGEKNYRDLPSYLYGFDVCLIPFVKNNLTLATNPVKVYEYLASGKPVVSVDLPELENLSDIVKLAETPEKFEIAIQEAIEENSDVESKQRRDFALSNTWESRFITLKEDLNKRYFPKVSIIIVTYNNWALTKQCLDSLLSVSDYPNREVIVVDNMSSDETKIQLSRIIHPDLKIILSPTNTGFAGGNLIGCQASSGDFIILLNNDTIVTPGWIQRLIRPFIEDESIGMCGPVSNSVGNDQMLDFFRGNPVTGPDPHWLNEFYELYRGRTYYTETLGFFCVAIRREVYEKVGDLDTAYGIGMFEDDDYCERVKNAGYKLAVVEDAFVYHHGSASFNKLENEKYRKVWEKNKNYFEQKWNKNWEFPKPPRNLFLGMHDAESVALVLKNQSRIKTLILGNKDWKVELERWQMLARKLVALGHLVVVYVYSYHGEVITGIRKLGENLYLSNLTELFSDATFDLLLYCSELNEQSIRSKVTVIDQCSYPEDVKCTVGNNYYVINESDISNFIKQLQQYIVNEN
ncbi:glycosyltransferase [Paenibacillus thiaminolyticus]|uniref:glycosyltransferase n=1 Tax=Paenibacillus thiaminolyticus TaxID=49283 RepID=UPI00232BC184|nr:glycosyltransferase [Paenibacillus thiaminolyticus]WCF07873.1 glycosyltransferase [Paenibacillus thiaminolyticus]